MSLLSKLDSVFGKGGDRFPQLQTALQNQDYPQAEQLFHDMRKSLSRTKGPEAEAQLRQVELMEARMWRERKQPARATEMLQRGLSTAWSAGDIPAAQESGMELLQVLVEAGRDQDAMQLQEHLLTSLQLAPVARANVQLTVAQILMEDGKAAQARERLLDALRCLEPYRNSRLVVEKIIQCYSLFGDACLACDDLSGVTESWHNALDLTRSIHGPEHPQMAAIFGSLGSVHILADQLPKAQHCLENAMHIYRHAKMMETLEAGIALNHLSFALMAQGELGRAEEYAAEAVRIGFKHNPQLRKEAQDTLQRIQAAKVATQPGE